MRLGYLTISFLCLSYVINLGRVMEKRLIHLRAPPNPLKILSSVDDSDAVNETCGWLSRENNGSGLVF